MPKKTRKRFTAQEKVAILRLHLLEHVPVSDLCDQHGAVDGAVVDRAEPQHVGPDVHEGHDSLVDQEQHEQRDHETDAEPLQP